LNSYFIKTVSFGILIIKTPDRMLPVQKQIRHYDFRIHVLSVFTIKTPRAHAGLAPFGILMT